MICQEKQAMCTANVAMLNLECVCSHCQGTQKEAVQSPLQLLSIVIDILIDSHYYLCQRAFLLQYSATFNVCQWHAITKWS